MTDIDTVDERLRAVERAISDGDASDATLTDPSGELTERIERVEEEIADLEAAVEAIRGYVGHVRSLDESVEQEVDATLSAVDELHERVDRLESERPAGSRSSAPAPGADSGPSRPDRSAPHRHPATTDGGRTERSDATSHPESTGSGSDRQRPCPYCNSTLPGSESGVHETRRDPPSRDEPQERTADTPPVEDVDEDGLVGRLREKL